MRIVLDGMGGDNAPQVVVEGAVAATKEMPHEIIIVGQEEAINECLKNTGYTGDKISVVNATEVITNEMVGIINVSFPSSSLVHFNGNQSISK